MEFREFSAKSVDEAITKASIEFETSSENLEIQVISQGKAGFLGFGAKPAIIRAGKKEEEEILPEDVKEGKEPAKKSAPARKEEKKEQKKIKIFQYLNLYLKNTIVMLMKLKKEMLLFYY